jgi:arylsulfatase A-like enzyme
VPLVARWNGIIKPGTEIDQPVSSPDFFRTIMELAGGTTPSSGKLDGTNLLPLLRGGAIPARKLFWHYPHYGNQGGAPGSALRDGDWKLIEWYEDERRELFNLREDPEERRDRAAEMPAKVKELAGRLETWRKETGALAPTRNNNYDASKASGRAAVRQQ